jgi:hypothetical protein
MGKAGQLAGRGQPTQHLDSFPPGHASNSTLQRGEGAGVYVPHFCQALLRGCLYSVHFLALLV